MSPAPEPVRNPGEAPRPERAPTRAWLSLPRLLGRIKGLFHFSGLDRRQRIGDFLAERHGRGVDRGDAAVVQSLTGLAEPRLAVGPEQQCDEALDRVFDDATQV